MLAQVCPSHPASPPWRAPAKVLLLAGLLAAACSKHTATNPADAPKVPVTKEDHLIAQARAALGPEDKLLAVQTLKMDGQVFDEKDQLEGNIEFLFKKSARQRAEFHSTGRAKAVQASNGVEGWMVSAENPDAMKFSIIKPPDETQNVYTAMENLYFYRAAELVRGSEVTSEGPVTYRNSSCWKVSFHYPGSLTYVRYFDEKTGDLRGTILLPDGTELVEVGKKIVTGIAFPTELQNYTADGKLTQTVKFTSIKVNTPIDDKVFETPSLISLRAASKTDAPSTPAAITSTSNQAKTTPSPSAPSSVAK